MLQTTHVFLFNSKWQILLGMKKRWFGIGKWNWFGGKNHEGETIKETALRELSEEAGIFLNERDVEKIGILHFFNEGKPERNQDVHVFHWKYDGEFSETEEMKPQWRDIEKIPYDSMREDDPIRLPKLISKKSSFDMTFTFNKEGKLADYSWE